MTENLGIKELQKENRAENEPDQSGYPVQFYGILQKPKVVLTFLLGFILCFLLSSRIMPVIQAYKSPVQMLEPFLWTFGDTTAILLSSVLLLLLFSDLPVLSAITPYYLCRTTKKRWLFGQLFYVSAVSGIYTVFMLGATMILCSKVGYPGNIWSDTAAMLAYSKLGENLNVPSTVKVMESVTPYGCTAQVILLLFLYILCLSFIVLAGNLFLGKTVDWQQDFCSAFTDFFWSLKYFGFCWALKNMRCSG